MQLNPSTVALSFRAQVPNPPGRTPVSTHVSEARARVPVAGTDRSHGLVGVGARPLRAPSALHNVLEFLEDAVLLLLIVFMVPAVIMLLALPVVLITRVAVEIARRL